VTGCWVLKSTHFRSLGDHPQVCNLFEAESQKGNGRLALLVQIRKFHLFIWALAYDDGAP